MPTTQPAGTAEGPEPEDEEQAAAAPTLDAALQASWQQLVAEIRATTDIPARLEEVKRLAAAMPDHDDQ